MKNVLQPLARSVLIPLGLTTAASAANVGIPKENIGSGMAALIISSENMEDIMKTFKSLEDSGLLIKDVTKTIGNEAKEQRSGFVGIVLGTLGAILLGDMFVGKVVIRTGEEIIGARQDF